MKITRDPADHTRRDRIRRERTVLSRYLAEIKGYPLLRREEEATMAVRNPESLILSNLRFVVKIAAGFAGRGLPIEDLINEGNLGLIRAAERYDPKRGTRFITYAAYWIRKALRQALSDQSSTVRIPRYQVLKARRETENGAETKTARSAPIVSSLDEPASAHTDRTQGDFLRDEAAEDPEERAVRKDLLAKLESLLDRLDTRERAVIVGRFGLSGSEGLTLQQVGDVFGLSRERIRQIEREARGKLRERLEPTRRRPRDQRRPTGRRRCNPFARPGS